MAYHEWGDEGVDWKGIEDSGQYIATYLKRWGRISAHAKEKYGTVRIEYLYFNYSLHSLLYPGHMFTRWPVMAGRFMGWLDNKVWTRVLHITGLYKLILKYQFWIYRRAYNNAVKKWPHLRAEILTHAEHDLLGLDPAEFGWSTFE